MEWWDQVNPDCFAGRYLFVVRRRFMHILFPALNNGPIRGTELVNFVAHFDADNFQKQIFQMDLLGSTYN